MLPYQPESVVPKHQPPNWVRPTALCVSGAFCLTLVLWAFSEFLALRGVIHVLASRIFLAVAVAFAILGWFSWTRLIPRKRNLWWGIGAVIFVVAGFVLDWWAPKPQEPQSNQSSLGRVETLELYYGALKLDEASVKNLQIVEPKREEMAIRQTKIFVEPNFSNMFTMTGIVPRNIGSVAVQADSAYLEFEVPIELMAANSSPWRLSSEKESGWAVRYDFFYPVNTIGAGHPGYIPDFTGSPIPTKAVKVKLVIIYGRGKTSAVFTLAPLAK